MKRGLSVINIIIIIGLISLAYLSYTRYLDNKIKQILNNPDYPPKHVALTDAESATSTGSPIKTPAIPAKTAPPKIQTPEAGETAPAAKKGYYENNTYFYQISFPENWPIRVRAENNVSLGTVPPKNGQGAITIEVSQGGSNELEQAKAEAKKYPGIISITEEPITLAGINGEKIILNNLMAKTKSINILLKKSNLNYIIQYSEESSEFTAQVNKALTTFKFTK
ncbi:MAG: PsbP-related protein [Patescibacteria group bacterium]|jgi:hypothetical protein